MGKEKAIIFPCFGGASNVGVVTALATLEAVKEVGLDKAGIGCLAILPIFGDSMKSQMAKAKKIISVDGCPVVCAKQLVERAGLKTTRSIVLQRDIKMENKSLDIDTESKKDISQHIEEEEIKKAKDLIVKAILE
jgi:uncharacterized metal-binding protein